MKMECLYTCGCSRLSRGLTLPFPLGEYVTLDPFVFEGNGGKGGP